MSAELKVFDATDGTSDILVDLLPLIAAVLAVSPTAVNWHWFLLRGAYGYGEYVCELEAQASVQDAVAVDLNEVIEHLRNGEYFDHAEFIAPDEHVEVARIDSTFLRLRGPEALVLSCAQQFDATEVTPYPG
jgi:hypothetical protein